MRNTTAILPDKDHEDYNQPTNQYYTTYYRTNITWMKLWGERCTTTILPDKDNNDKYRHYRHGYTTNTSSYGTNNTCMRR